MPTRAIWATRVAQLAKRALVAFVCRSWMRRRRCASVRHCRRIYRSNRSTEATPQWSVKFPAQHPVWHLHRCRVWKLSILKQLNVPTQKPSTSRIPLAFYLWASVLLRGNQRSRISNVVFVFYKIKHFYLEIRLQCEKSLRYGMS